MNALVLITPELFLTVLALGLLVGEAFLPHHRRLWINLGIAGLAIAGANLVLFFTQHAMPGAAAQGVVPAVVKGGWVEYSRVLGMLSVDSLSQFFKLAIAGAMILVLWLSSDYREFEGLPMGTYVSLMLMATVGMFLLVSSADLLMAVISLELLSITSFILAGFTFTRRSASEGAIKFFLVGAFSSAILLFGISYYYGYFGTTDIAPLLAAAASGSGADVALSLILMFLVAGIGFKLAMVPFHMWAPDAYEGAPTPVTAFLSVAPKAAAIGFLLRLLVHHASLGLAPVLGILAALTMTVGNIGALHQTNVKRLLAYSSVAQVGYILVALVAGGSLGAQAAMVYTFVYLFMNLGVFAAVIAISNKSASEEITDFAGLSRRSMGLSLAVVVFMLSLTGIPPLAGFIGKFAIFSSVMTPESDLLWLGIVAVLNSVVSLYYYFRIVQQMFFREPEGGQPLWFSPALLSCLAVALVVTLTAGILPDTILGWVRNVVGS